MLSLVIFFALISSGSVLCAAVWNRKYEEIVPITCSCIVMILFLFGIIGVLETGVIFICILGVGLYVFAMIWSITQNKIKDAVLNILTPAFFVYIFSLVFFAFFIGGKMLWRWDEFSHWGDIVKVMTILNDFGTNPESHSTFQSYPPGMSLFQYVLQKINMWVTKTEFSEWRLYFAQQVFCLSFFMPFLKKIKKESIFQTLGYALVIFLVPLLFFDDFYTSIYIDQVLGILTGTGLAMILWHRKKDISYSLYIWFVCGMLVLVKDAGMLFATIVGLVYIIDCFLESKKYKSKNWIQIINASITLLMIFIPKMLWNYNIAINGAGKVFGGDVDLVQLLAVVLGKDSTYKSTVWKNFYRSMITTTVPLGNTGIELNYLCLILIFLLLVGIIIKIAENRVYITPTRGKVVFVTVILTICIYIVGICVTYMFKFSEYEALNLASFSRYMNIVFLAVWVIIILSMIRILKETDVSYSNWCVLGLICLMVIVSPMESVYKYISREAVTISTIGRRTYEELTNEIKKNVTSNDRVYFISQETSGFDFWVMRYNSRPNYNTFSGAWSIGEPFYEGDVSTQEMTQEEWLDILCENYDYVALFKTNDYFIENFGDAFENKGDIAVNCVYKVNKETRQLVLCE